MTQPANATLGTKPGTADQRSWSRAFALILAVLLAALVAGCGGQSKAATKPDSSLKNADRVQQSQAAAAANIVQIGEFGDLPGNGRVEVTAMKVGGDDLGPWLEATMRVENASKETASVPDTGIVCTGSTQQGGYQVDSTMRLSDEIPAGSYKEGVLNLIVPGDSRTGQPATPCAAPAFVQITGLDNQSLKTGTVRVPIAGELLAQLNAKLKK
jgi:hypothetical protein